MSNFDEFFSQNTSAESTPSKPENYQNLDAVFGESENKENRNIVDKHLTNALNFIGHTAKDMYELGVDTYDLVKKRQEKNKDLSIVGQAIQSFDDVSNILKGGYSALTLGYYQPSSENKEEQTLQKIGQYGGVGSIIGKISNLLGAGYSALTGGSIPTIVTLPTSVSAYSFGQQTQEIATGKREEYDTDELIAAALGSAGLSAIVETVPSAIKWMDNMRPSQKLKLAKGKIPQDLPPSSYTEFNEVIYPEWIKELQNEYSRHADIVYENIERDFQENLQRSEYDYKNTLDQLRKENNLNENTYNEANRLFEESEAKSKAEYEQKLSEIEAENQKATIEFQQAQEQWNEYVQFNNRLNQALEMRARHSQDNNVGFKQSAPSSEIPTTRNSVGNIISQTEITNPTSAGRSLQTLVRDIAQHERRAVNELYRISEELNMNVETIAPELASWIQDRISQLEEIPELSGPSKQLLRSYQSMLKTIVEFDENGHISGYKEIPNRVLLEQAKELRNKIDYDFAEGNPTRIFQDFIDQLQDQAERAAQEVGNDAAYNANIQARTAHRHWKNRYDRDFIRQLRDVSDSDFQSAFNKSLSVDNIMKLDPILSQSQPGGNLLSAIRREAVQEHMKGPINNPNNYTTEQKLLLLRDLEPITTSQQRSAISDTLTLAQRETPTQPKPPKLKEKPKSPTAKVPQKKPKQKTPEPFKFPEKRNFQDTPYMKYLEKQMSIGPEGLFKKLNDTKGIKEVRSTLSKTPKGKQVFEKIRDNQVKDIAYGNKIREPKTGKELYDTFNKKENYDLITEWYGEKTANEMLSTFEKIGGKEVNKTSLEKTLERTNMYHILKIISGMLFI